MSVYRLVSAAAGYTRSMRLMRFSLMPDGTEESCTIAERIVDTRTIAEEYLPDWIQVAREEFRGVLERAARQYCNAWEGCRE